MKRLILAAGVAALAITSPVMAKPDKDRGGKGHAAKVERGGGDRGRAERKAERRPDRRAERRSERRSDRRAERQDKRAEKAREARSERREKARERRVERRDDSRRERVREAREDRQERVRESREDRRERIRDARDDRRDRFERIRDRRDDRREALARLRDRDDDRRIRVRDRDLDDWWDDRFDDRFDDRRAVLGFGNGCPPGLAKKSPACIPPGQAKKLIGQRVSALDRAYAVPLGLRDLYRDTDDYYYRYDDGYMYRVNRGNDLIRALMPLFGGGLLVGQQFPYGYNSPNYALPSYYQPFYQSGADDYYRYNNGYVYEIDRSSGLIEDIIPMYDRGYGVGQMLPASYSYYNVPYPYRSYYADDDDYLYRYAPGAIYQVDRETQLITAIASLLTGSNAGLAVGQPLPMGYSAYNVPYAYRDRYYDTPNNWYRYSNGNIYRVDPQTRLITALIQAIV